MISVSIIFKYREWYKCRCYRG